MRPAARRYILNLIISRRLEQGRRLIPPADIRQLIRRVTLPGIGVV